MKRASQEAQLSPDGWVTVWNPARQHHAAAANLIAWDDPGGTRGCWNVDSSEHPRVAVGQAPAHVRSSRTARGPAVLRRAQRCYGVTTGQAAAPVVVQSILAWMAG